jgi:tetratricopeptide (TPR) repeat protein
VTLAVTPAVTLAVTPAARGARLAIPVAMSAAIIAAALACTGVAPALAQSTRYPPPPVDADERGRAPSGFWERVLHPADPSFHPHLAAARSLLEQADGQAAAQALSHLEQAVALAPEHPEVHWLRGLAAERLRRWDLCAESYGRLFAMEPAYTPTLVPRGREAAWALDAGLGLCLAQRGQYEAAIAQLKRIASRGAVPFEVYVNMAESYMALGRLAEAIDTLVQVSRHHNPSARVEHVLAAAYDRKQMPDHAREHVRTALRLGPMALLDAPDQVFTPPEESLYYLGLAHTENGDLERALFSFRHYLHVHGNGPWRQRAQQHAERLARAPRTARSISVSNSADPMDIAALLAVVERADPGLQACVRAVPGALFTVRLTILPGSDKAARVRERIPLGVETQVAFALPSVDETAAAEAQRCLEAAAQEIALPRPRTPAGNYTMVTFPVIAR